uniref:Putative secreted protein n=1 Tax=Anopheles darlingi TaxID=43151 RepID=A0A2M4DRG7_ANODA
MLPLVTILMILPCTTITIAGVRRTETSRCFRLLRGLLEHNARLDAADELPVPVAECTGKKGAHATTTGKHLTIHVHNHKP